LEADHREEIAERTIAGEGVIGLVGLLQSFVGGFAYAEQVEVEAEEP
jgi:hypothetical protein